MDTRTVAIDNPQQAVTEWAQTPPTDHELSQAADVTGGVLSLADGTVVHIAPPLAAMLNVVLRSVSAHKTVHVEVDDQLITAQRAATLLGVTRPTVYAWQDRGLLPCVMVGTRRMLSLAGVLDYRDGSAERDAFLTGARDPVDDSELTTAEQELFAPTAELAQAFARIDNAAESAAKAGA